MIKYFFKLEWKNLVRNKYISFLKISGLVTGLLVFMVAGYYVLHELSYDHFQDHAQCFLLENFACKTDISWWIFIIAGVLALGIASLTVSWQSWRAANKNPVEALKYE